jgi:hypothetical protein
MLQQRELIRLNEISKDAGFRQIVSTREAQKNPLLCRSCIECEAHHAR